MALKYFEILIIADKPFEKEDQSSEKPTHILDVGSWDHMSDPKHENQIMIKAS